MQFRFKSEAAVSIIFLFAPILVGLLIASMGSILGH